MSGEGAGQPFNARLVASLIAAGVIAFAVFMLLLAYAGDSRTGRDGRSHALSVSAVGFQGVVKLIGLAGGTTTLLRDPDGLETEDLVVVTLESRVESGALAELISRRGARPTLVVLPKWNVIPDPARREWVKRIDADQSGMTGHLLKELGGIKVSLGPRPARAVEGSGVLAGVRVPLPARVQAISGGGAVRLLAGPKGEAVVAKVGTLYVLADPDLLNNHGLKDPRSARAALELLAALNATGAESVSFDLTLNGFAESPSALRLAFEPPFLPLTLALFVAALLAGLHGAFRFGPEAEEGRAIALGKAALVENSANLFRIARREHRVGSAYAELIREGAAHASGAGNALRGAELDAYLDRFSSPGGPTFSELAERAGKAGHRLDLAAAARALFQWKKGLIR